MPECNAGTFQLFLDEFLQLKNKESVSIDKEDGSKLIISYKDNRPREDAANRKKGYEKLKKKVQSGKFNKTNNNKGYNKYLKLEGETLISIDDEKYKDDAQ